MVDFNDVFRYDDGKLYWIINKNNHVRCGVIARKNSEVDYGFHTGHGRR